MRFPPLCDGICLLRLNFFVLHSIGFGIYNKYNHNFREYKKRDRKLSLVESYFLLTDQLSNLYRHFGFIWIV